MYKQAPCSISFRRGSSLQNTWVVLDAHWTLPGRRLCDRLEIIGRRCKKSKDERRRNRGSFPVWTQKVNLLPGPPHVNPAACVPHRVFMLTNGTQGVGPDHAAPYPNTRAGRMSEGTETTTGSTRRSFLGGDGHPHDERTTIVHACHVYEGIGSQERGLSGSEGSRSA